MTDVDTDIKPITFSGIDKNGNPCKITFARIHSSVPKKSGKIEDGLQRMHGESHQIGKEEPNHKKVGIMVWQGSDENPVILSQINIDDDHFVVGMKMLLAKIDNSDNSLLNLMNKLGIK